MHNCHRYVKAQVLEHERKSDVLQCSLEIGGRACWRDLGGRGAERSKIHCSIKELALDRVCSKVNLHLHPPDQVQKQRLILIG